MKLKMTDDFKKASKGMVFYAITSIVIFPIYHLIKGDFDWGDTLINAGLMVLICLSWASFSTSACRFLRKMTSKRDETEQETKTCIDFHSGRVCLGDRSVSTI